VLSNIGVAAQRSLLSINYFEFFAAVQQKALRVLRNDESQPEEKAAAVDIISRISASMGRCLEDITKQQAFILTSSTVVRREPVLQQHKLPDDVSKWLRAQPVLSGEALFGTVADIAQPLMESDLVRRTSQKFIATPGPRREPAKTQQNHRPDNQTPRRGRSAALTQSYKPKPRTDHKKPDFSYGSRSKPKGGYSKKPFPSRESKGQGRKN
jgi:hypothetical protein